MSSDGKEPGAIWHHPAPSRRASADQSLQEPLSLAQEDEYQPPAVEQGGSPYVAADDAYGDSQPAGWRRLLQPFESLKQFSSYTPLLLLPVLFLVLASIIILPRLRPDALLPVALLLIAIAIIQAVAVYLSGEQNGMWILGTVAGLYLFLLIGCFALAGLLPTALLLVALIALSIYLARLYIHPVPEGFVDIVYSFGKYKRTLYPGMNILLPWEKTQQQLNVGETQWICPPQRVQLSREEDVILRASISYQLLPEDAYLAITKINKWEDSLRELLLTSIQSIVTTFTPEDFISWSQGVRRSMHLGLQEDQDGARWERVNAQLMQHLSDKVAMWGVQINWVRIRDVTLAPHGAPLIDTEPMPSQRYEETPSSPRIPVPTPPVAARVAKAQKSERPQPKPAATPPPIESEPPSTPSASAPKVPREEILIKAYKEVQSGNITDPETIRSIAAKFEAIATDTEASQHVSFDASRAALNLYAQARKYEEEVSRAGPIFDDETHADNWQPRQARDENMLAGG